MVKVIDLRPETRPVDCGIVYDPKEVPSSSRYYGPFGRVLQNTAMQEVWRVRQYLIDHHVFNPGHDFLFIAFETRNEGKQNVVLSWVEEGGYIRNANPRR